MRPCTLARYRLRFLLQEFDLVGPEVIVGRSPECHVTIEDPLVSRQHARIRFVDGAPLVSDLGSRNGVRVNGERINGEVELKDGDRLRLGTQELVFAVVKGREAQPRPTGFMRMCRSCGTPYPEGAPNCPHCGADTGDEDTMSGVNIEPKRGWAFHMLGEVLDRAVATGRATEAERLLRRMAKDVDAELARGERLDPNQLAMAAACALRVAKLIGGTEWVAWTLGMHRRLGQMPAVEVIDQLEQLDTAAFPEIRAVVDQFVAWCGRQAEDAPPADLARLARLERVARGG